jgi:hypothetical protein
MALPEPENTKIDHAKLDSGIHIRDSEAAQASLWQVFITALVVVAILTVFFYGVTEQRNEDGVAQIAGAQPSQQSNVASPAGADQQTANSGKANTAAPAPAVKQAPASATTGAAPTSK